MNQHFPKSNKLYAFFNRQQKHCKGQLLLHTKIVENDEISQQKSY